MEALVLLIIYVVVVAIYNICEKVRNKEK